METKVCVRVVCGEAYSSMLEAVMDSRVKYDTTMAKVRAFDGPPLCASTVPRN